MTLAFDFHHTFIALGAAAAVAATGAWFVFTLIALCTPLLGDRGLSREQVYGVLSYTVVGLALTLLLFRPAMRALDPPAGPLLYGVGVGGWPVVGFFYTLEYFFGL